MVLYLSIQLRCHNKNKTKMFIKCRTHSSFHFHQEVNHQNVTHFTLNGNQRRPTMKKHLKIQSLLNEQAKLQFTKLTEITSLRIKQITF